jgi:hypothetical protein
VKWPMAQVANTSFQLYREDKQRWVYLRKSACSSDSTTNQQSHSSVRLRRLRVRELSSVVHNDCNDIPEEMARSTSPHPDIVITCLTSRLFSPEEQGDRRRWLHISHISCNAQATEYHLGLLKAKLAKYRAQLLEPVGKSSGGGTGFDVQKAGGARTVA